MHGLHIELCKKALEYLAASEEAFKRVMYNASGLLSQVSAELAVKATISYLGYTFPEAHEIRKPLSLLSTFVLKNEITEFVRDKRGELILLEDARQRGQYLSYGLTREDAEVCLGTAKEVIGLVRKVWGEKRCSG